MDSFNSLKNSHRMFLQSFLSRNLLDAKQVRQLYKQCCDTYNEAYPDADKEQNRLLQEHVLLINHNLRPFQMEIKKGVSEEDGRSYYVLVNLTESKITQLASDYSQNELDLFKKIVEQIVESEEGRIGSMEVLNLTENLSKRMSKTDAEEFLTRLQRETWIQKVDGQISLAVRGILELEQYILEMYPEIATKCNMCKKLCLRGQSCDSCNTRLHFHCASKFFKDGTEPKCPGQECGARWPHQVPERGTSEFPASQDPGTSQSRKRKK